MSKNPHPIRLEWTETDEREFQQEKARLSNYAAYFEQTDHQSTFSDLWSNQATTQMRKIIQ